HFGFVVPKGSHFHLSPTKVHLMRIPSPPHPIKERASLPLLLDLKSDLIGHRNGQSHRPFYCTTKWNHCPEPHGNPSRDRWFGCCWSESFQRNRCRTYKD